MRTAFQLGVFAFGMATVDQLAPSLLSDTEMSGLQFSGATLTFLATLFCAYKSFSTKASDVKTPS